MTEDDEAPEVYFCHQCECFHKAGQTCLQFASEEIKRPAPTALDVAVKRLNIWAYCVECSQISNLSNLFVCPKCCKHRMLIYLDLPNALDAIRVEVPGAKEAAEALAGQKERVPKAVSKVR